MCYWQGQAGTRLEVPSDAPLTAWRVFRVDEDGCLISPHQQTRWEDGCLESHASVWDAIRGEGMRAGIFCFKNLTGALREHGKRSNSVIAKIEIWGTVISYRHRSGSGYFGSSRYSGYRAQHARILEAYPVVEKPRRYSWSRNTGEWTEWQRRQARASGRKLAALIRRFYPKMPLGIVELGIVGNSYYNVGKVEAKFTGVRV